MPSDRLFGPSFSTEAMGEAVSDLAWVQRMLDVEAAIARAEARVGLIPPAAAGVIAASCDAARFDVDQLGREAVAAGNPVIPLVRALTALLPAEASRYVHWGVTSQDVLDTAMMLIARDGLELIGQDLDRVAEACARLVERHRSTVMPGRTLLQHALPITFGLKAAGWLTAVVEARERLTELRERRLAIQFGGAAGTLASLGARGLEVAGQLSAELGLAEPVVPWHTARARVAELGLVAGVVAGTMGKIALDVALLMQTEVAEVSEPSGPGRGGSSTLPQKRNPVGAAAVNACARGVNGQVAVLLAAMGQDHERAAGAWQAEWAAVSEVLRLTAGAVSRSLEVLDGLTVDEVRMRSNLDLSGGMLMSEHVMMVLAERIGRHEAHEVVRGAAEKAASSGRPFREALLADPVVADHLGPAELDTALDPAGYLGSTEPLIDRALARYKAARSAGA